MSSPLIKTKDMNTLHYMNNRTERTGQILELTGKKEENYTECIVNISGFKRHILVKDVLANHVGAWVTVSTAGSFCVAVVKPYGPIMTNDEKLRRIMDKF